MIAAIKSGLLLEAIVGLDKKIYRSCSLDDSKDHASTLYSWIMNFKFFDAAVKEFYDDSLEIRRKVISTSTLIRIMLYQVIQVVLLSLTLLITVQ